MPCCSVTVTTNTSPANADDLLRVAVTGTKPDGLNTVFSFYNTINQNPVLIETNWEPESLLFLHLSELKVSSGKFRAIATFRKLATGHNSGAPARNWLTLLMALWENA
jgi:hypothetical protein